MCIPRGFRARVVRAPQHEPTLLQINERRRPGAQTFESTAGQWIRSLEKGNTKKMKKPLLIAALCLMFGANTALADKYELLTGVDPLHYPGIARSIPGDNGPGYPDLYDGDRLAGTSDVGPVVLYQGSSPGDLMFQPNEFGSLSMLYRRGTFPFGGFVPLMGIEFLGGPLLDLDGDPNMPRSLTPIFDVDAVVIPDTTSFIELTPDFGAGTITLEDFDVTGTNESGPQQSPQTATILVTIAGTLPDGAKDPPLNPTIDTRVGTLTPFVGNSGTLTSVWAIADLGFEVWEDSLLVSGSSPDELGTMQFLGAFNGWLVKRDATGGFPTLTGEGLGGTQWPAVDVSQIGLTHTSAIDGTAVTINGGVGTDDYTTADNGGLALTDFGGDLGGYFDNVVLPLLPQDAGVFVYLQSAGFGISTSPDPIFGDSIGYDVVVIAAAGDPCAGTTSCDSNCDGAVNFGDIDPFVVAITEGPAAWSDLVGGACDYVCANDTNGDGAVNFGDIDPFVACITGG